VSTRGIVGPRAARLLNTSELVRSWFEDSDGLWVSLADGYELDGLRCLHIEPSDYSENRLRAELSEVARAPAVQP
jgi:hypothetical protein